MKFATKLKYVEFYDQVDSFDFKFYDLYYKISGFIGPGSVYVLILF